MRVSHRVLDRVVGLVEQLHWADLQWEVCDVESGECTLWAEVVENSNDRANDCEVPLTVPLDVGVAKVKGEGNAVATPGKTQAHHSSSAASWEPVCLVVRRMSWDEMG
jgi:hypothetical protein